MIFPPAISMFPYAIPGECERRYTICTGLDCCSFRPSPDLATRIQGMDFGSPPQEARTKEVCDCHLGTLDGHREASELICTTTIFISLTVNE